MSEIKQILESALAAMTPPLDIASDNAKYNPTIGVAYQACSILFAKPENPAGKGFHREVGYMQVTLRYPLNQGTGLIDARAKLIRTTFPYGRTWTSGQITLTVSGTPEISSGRADGDRWSIPVKVPFFANVFE